MSPRHFAIPMVLTALGGCGFGGSGAGSGADAGPDGGADAAVDAAPAPCVAWTPADGPSDPCAAELGTPVALNVTANATLDTGTGKITVGTGAPLQLPGIAMTRAGYPSLRVVNLSSLQVAAGQRLTFTGANTVLFLVHGDATIGGTIDASAPLPSSPAQSAPGADSSRCTADNAGKPGMPATSGSTAGSGGGGGALTGDGGDGGDGEGGITKGGKGSKDDGDLPLRGGCPGGRGGDDNNGVIDQGGLPGGGGGGFLVSARGTITVTGTLAANGAPGRGADLVRAGGGGAGSGGTIGLDGNRLTLQAGSALCAKGGGGGEGSSVIDGDRGDTVSCTVARAQGGSGLSVTSGNGGAGGSEATLDGDDGAPGTAEMAVRGGGGGGGGGVGKVLLRARVVGGLTNSSSIVTPTPTVL